jgi:hypothetical protein
MVAVVVLCYLIFVFVLLAYMRLGTQCLSCKKLL